MAGVGDYRADTGARHDRGRAREPGVQGRDHVRGGDLKRAGLIAALLVFVAAGAQADTGATLKPYAACEGFANGVRIKRHSRRSVDEPPWREVTAKGVIYKISVIDGIRTVYAYPDKEPFADLKAEASDPAKYAEDKRELQRIFEVVAKTEGPGAYTTLKGRGYTGQEVVKPALEGSTLAITQLFFDADKVVVSIYFPYFSNIPAFARSFSDHKQFLALRAAFVQGYLECIGRQLK